MKEAIVLIDAIAISSLRKVITQGLVLIGKKYEIQIYRVDDLRGLQIKARFNTIPNDTNIGRFQYSLPELSWELSEANTDMATRDRVSLVCDFKLTHYQTII